MCNTIGALRFKTSIFFLFIIINTASAQVITTYAGNGVAGYSGDGGLAVNAMLNIPYSLAFDKNKNLYIADNPNNRIRKIDAITHVITTVVGLGTNGGNCLLSQAGLQNPRGIAFDKAGNLYISDASTCIRKVDFTKQTVTTIAGIRGQYGNNLGDGGPALQAEFDGTAGIAIDSNGNIFVADMGNNRIRRIDVVTNIITTYAGSWNSFDYGEDELATDAVINQPIGITFDNKGNLFIADAGHKVIRKVDQYTNIISVVAGKMNQWGYGGDGGMATKALINTPMGIVFDKEDNYYITDCLNNRIRKIDSKTGIISTIAGTGVAGYAGDCGPAINALLNWPVAITLDDAGQVYFTEQNNNTVRKISTSYDSLVTGAETICLHDSITLNTLESGGVWSSSNANIAAVNTNGVVKGLLAGGAIISYTINLGGCEVITAHHQVSVNAINESNAIVSSQNLCNGSVYNLTESASNGFWFSNHPDTVKTDGAGHIECLESGTAVLKYMVNQSCSITDKVFVQVFNSQPLFLGNDTSICSNTSLEINAGNGFIKYNWNTKDTTQSITVNKAGIYGLQATDINACVSSDSIIISKILELPVFNWPDDSAFCVDDSIQLLAPLNTKSLVWQDGSSAPFYVVTAAGEYSLIATGYNGCVDTATIQIMKSQPPAFSLGPDTILCSSKTLSYNFNIPNSSYLWSDGSRSNTYAINKPGQYSLTVNQQGCEASDTVNVNYNQAPIINLGNDTTLCEGNTKLLSVSNNSETFLWQDGSNNPTYLVNKPGEYFVAASVNNCISSDTINIIYNSIPVFSLGADTFLCAGVQLKLQPVIHTSVQYLWQDGSRQPFYNVENAGLYSLKAFNQCGYFTDSIQIKSAVCNLNMPTAFTPNNDGLNDVFSVKYLSYVTQFSMSIYNRWGYKIFQSFDVAKGWDGNYKAMPAATDTYIWIISFIDQYGNKQTKHGSVTLIR